METSITIMRDKILEILKYNSPTIYMFGSVVLDDFKLGWSDIDIICLCEEPILKEQADTLVYMRQSLLDQFPGNLYYRSFEGGFITWDAFMKNSRDNVVYWGTSGERITDTYQLDPFSLIEIKKYGRLLYGIDKREIIPYPSRKMIVNAVTNVYKTIRNHGIQTSRRITSTGWLLDIARCLYTLETNDVIAKTESGRWAISKGLVPDTDVMQKVIEIREHPKEAAEKTDVLDWCASIGPHIQTFADVLEQRLSLECQ